MFDNLPRLPEQVVARIRGDVPKPAPKDQRSLQERLRARSRALEASTGDYGRTALERELGYLRAASQGTRNHALNKTAFSLFQLVDAGTLDEWEVTEALTTTARDIGLTPQEITQTMGSARQGAAKTPRPSSRLPAAPSVRTDAPAARPAVAREGQEPVDEETGDPGYLELIGSHKTLHEVWAMPDPKPLVRSTGGAYYFMLDSLAMIWGPPGSKKSFSALDLSLCVSTGQWWHGLTVTQGPVCYFVGEGLSGLKQRTKAWCIHNNLIAEPDDWHAFGLSFDLLNRSKRTTRHASQIIAEIAPRLVIIDTFHRHSLGANENDARDMGTIIGSLEELRYSTNGVCILVVHHSNKAGEAERGHSSLLGAIDTSVEVKSDQVKTELAWRKQKEAGLPPSLNLYTYPVEGTGSIVLTDRYLGADEHELAEKQADRVLGELQLFRAGPGGSVEDIATAIGCDPVTVKKALSILAERGLVEKRGAYSWGAK